MIGGQGHAEHDARALRELREQAGWTREEAAALCGLPYWTLVTLEQGKRRLAAYELGRLASVYGLGVDELYRRLYPAEEDHRRAMREAGLPERLVNQVDDDVRDMQPEVRREVVREHIAGHQATVSQSGRDGTSARGRLIV